MRDVPASSGAESVTHLHVAYGIIGYHIYERILWRNSAADKVVARFVIVRGTNYEVTELPE